MRGFHYFFVTSLFCKGGFLLLLWLVVSCTCLADESGSSGSTTGALQNANYIINYLHTLQRSQDEMFRKIDWLTKTVEEKDHENYQFRLKFSRKVHTLENKVLYMEQTFTQKVEQVVQKKVNEMMAAADSRLHHYYHRSHNNPISGSSSSPSSPSRNSHGSPPRTNDDNNDDNTTSGPIIMEIQNYQPQHQPHNNHNPYHRYQYNSHQQLPPYATTTTTRNSQNWGFYEHPITHKRVRESQPNLFGVGGYEPPTRDLPRISLMATGATSRIDDNLQEQEQQQNSRTTRRPIPDGGKGGSSSLLSVSSTNNRALVMEAEEATTTRERDGGHKVSKLYEANSKKFESYDMALKLLRENVTNLEREILRAMSYQNREYDNSEMHRMLVDTKKEVTSLEQKHKEMVHMIEHFTVEMEKAAAKREHAMNESLIEISSELRKQITAVKVHTKKQIQNMTVSTTGTSGNSPQSPDKLRCAQTLLDELLAHAGTQKSHQSQVTQSDFNLFADQAGEGSDERKGNEKALFYMSRRSSADNKQSSTDNLMKELVTQRKDITELKSEMGKLNISQVLLMKMVDEETLKRTVRPRDCTEIRLLRNASSGVYSIFPKKNDAPTEVYCDMYTDGGGWTVIQRRGASIPHENNGMRESFAKNWDEYEKGFGSLLGDFWLGLSNVAQLCQLGVQELRVELTNWSGETRFATYQYFKISNASRLYRINVRGYSGTAGDSLSRHNGMAFSTPDQDHDVDPRRHCAKTYYSGWWYYACFESNLNGLYIGDQDNNDTTPHHAAFGTGVIWHHWTDNDYSLKTAEMKIRNRFI